MLYVPHFIFLNIPSGRCEKRVAIKAHLYNYEFTASTPKQWKTNIQQFCFASHRYFDNTSSEQQKYWAASGQGELAMTVSCLQLEASRKQSVLQAGGWGINRGLFACGGHKVPLQLRVSWPYSYKWHFLEACNTPVSICRQQLTCHTSGLWDFVFPWRKIYVMREEQISKELALRFETLAFIFKLCLLKSCLALINMFLLPNLWCHAWGVSFTTLHLVETFQLNVHTSSWQYRCLFYFIHLRPNPKHTTVNRNPVMALVDIGLCHHEKCLY